MKTIYLDLQMGAAGDMLSAALLGLLDDPEAFIDEISQIGLKNVQIQARKKVNHGIAGLYYEVKVHGVEEDDVQQDRIHDHEANDYKEFQVHPHSGADSRNDHGSACQNSQMHNHDHFHDQEHTHIHNDDHVHEPIHLHDDHVHVHTHNDDHVHAHSHDDDHFHNHQHSLDHSGHHHHHHHASMAEIEAIVSSLQVSKKVRTDILNVYRLIAQAESRAHGMEVSDIHFHEVGSLDAIADIASVCLLLEKLDPDQVIASPVCTGSGSIHCAHGILPVPAPATAYLLEEIPMYAGSIQGELCTPTGAALLKYFVNSFQSMPVMNCTRIGYGMGKRDFGTLNCIRSFLGETSGGKDQVIQLSCSIDDMTGEEIGYAMEKIRSCNARDVFAQSCMMKKSRPGILLTVLCLPEQADQMVRTIFSCTTTLGIRQTVCDRFVLERSSEIRETEFGPVRFKSSCGYGVRQAKPEFDDLRQIADANDLSLREVISRLDQGKK